MQRALTGGRCYRRASSSDELSSDFWLQPSFASIQSGFSGIYNFPGCFSLSHHPRGWILPAFHHQARKTPGHQLMRHGEDFVPFGTRWVEHIYLSSFKTLNSFLLFKAKAISTLLAPLFFTTGRSCLTLCTQDLGLKTRVSPGSQSASQQRLRH